MKKEIVVLLLMLFVCSNVSFAYSASSLKREISYIQGEIRQSQRKISAVKYLDRISEYDKKRQIRKLEYTIYQKKRELQKIKSEYKGAIS